MNWYKKAISIFPETSSWFRILIANRFGIESRLGLDEKGVPSVVISGNTFPYRQDIGGKCKFSFKKPPPRYERDIASLSKDKVAQEILRNLDIPIDSLLAQATSPGTPQPIKTTPTPPSMYSSPLAQKEWILAEAIDLEKIPAGDPVVICKSEKGYIWRNEFGKEESWRWKCLAIFTMGAVHQLILRFDMRQAAKRVALLALVVIVPA